MSGWIKIDKDLAETIRFRRVVRKLRDSSNALRSVTDALSVTIVLGALQRFWVYADSHIRDDDTLDITPDEINEIVGVEGFAQALPADWLQVLDADQVKLPDFLEHNGSSEKQRRDNARRQATYRHRHKSRNVTRDVTDSNARNDARPDQKRPEKTRKEEELATLATRARETENSTEQFAKLKASYPAGTYRQSEWLLAEREVEKRLTEGHGWPDLHAGVERYAKQCEAKYGIGTQFVLSPAKFFRSGPAPPFLEPFPIPATKADTRLAGNLSAADEFMRRTEVAR